MAGWVSVRSLCATVVALVGAAAGAPAAWATFPGLNGQLAYEARDGGGVFTVQPVPPNLGQGTPLTFPRALDRDAAWSSDGRHIAFTSLRDGNAEIYLMKADGTEQRRLTTDPAFDADPTFSPDGTQLAFTSTRDGNTEIYVMAVDGSAQRRLTFDPAVDQQADWSPDGSRIAFESTRDINAEIYTMNPDGGAVTRLTFNPETDADPSWHPDGASIAFVSGEGPTLEVFTLRPGIPGRTRITHDAQDSHLCSPAWSPDGKQIAFTRFGITRVISADARGIGEPAADGSDAAWAPLPPPQPPKVSKTVNMVPNGTVFVRVKGAEAAAPLTGPLEIPIAKPNATDGTVIDSREGEATIETTTSPLVVSDGRATLSQTRGGVTVLRLPRHPCCGARRSTLRTRTRARTAASSAVLSSGSARRKHRKGSRVKSPGHSNASSGRTDWTTIRTRRSTTTRVHSGVVEVTPLRGAVGRMLNPRGPVTGRTVRVRAGQTYVARPRR
jgi:hypothetical protein